MVKKYVKILLTLSILVSCSKCTNSLDIDKKTILFESLFSQIEKTYWVLFFIPTCMSCKNTIIFIEDCYKVKKFIIYFVNMTYYHFTSNNEEESNVYLSKIDEIEIEKVPTLFLIKNKRVEKEIIGYQNISKETSVFYFC